MFRTARITFFARDGFCNRRYCEDLPVWDDETDLDPHSLGKAVRAALVRAGFKMPGVIRWRFID